VVYIGFPTALSSGFLTTASRYIILYTARTTNSRPLFTFTAYIYKYHPSHIMMLVAKSRMCAESKMELDSNLIIFDYEIFCFERENHLDRVNADKKYFS
jgi:hypothetical protein